jgi:hypothetical protein
MLAFFVLSFFWVQNHTNYNVTQERKNKQKKKEIENPS